ncbi:hypothetical protein [Variovorax rhizosphaerae]|uniref:Phasin protein n=1 Tax=Variovorax rhizosphaerae TaxID=1836200 RepID=A0ABU8WXG9_9BURK
MSNPWMARNPFMSIWLSAANQMIHAGRGFAEAEMQRQISAMQTEFQKQILSFWMGGWMMPRGKL